MKVCNIKAKVTIHSWENMKKKKKKNFNHGLFKKKKGKKIKFVGNGKGNLIRYLY